jgi:holo-[acyl-carrier protein] synthase
MKNQEIVGIGTDIEDIERFSDLDRESRLLNRVFTPSELEYCFSKRNVRQHLAARYAGKEAVVKAISSSGRKKPPYRDIEILNDETGAPRVNLGRSDLQDLVVIISLSHSRDKALAFAVAFSKG